MRPPPKLADFPRYPVVGGTALLAVAVTAAWWLGKVDVSPLFETAMIRRGELWRLLTSVFPHAGILHLAFNVYWLWVFGTLVEEVYGHLKTAALLLLFAIGPNALEFAFANGGIGLSGVGYGLFGLLWILSLYDQRFRGAIDRRTVELFIAWFFLCIVATVTGFMRIGNIAHGTGAVLGILTGYALALPQRRTVAAAGIGGILVFSLWASTLGRPRVNLSGSAGYEEGQWGYEALVAHRYPEAVRWFRDAVAYQPKNPAYWHDLGIAYFALSDRSSALAAYRKAADLNDAWAAYYLGKLYANGEEGLPKDPAQALAWYQRAATQDDPEALNSVAWEYATSSDATIRNPVAALGLARRAVGLDKDHPNPNHLDTLAEACYVNGQSEEAVKTEQQAIALAPAESKQDFQKRLEKYQQALQQQKPRRKAP